MRKFGEGRAWLKAHENYAEDDCLPWPFGRGKNGYGQIWINGKRITAHREMCVAVHGAPPTGKHEASHSCGKGHLGCCNPRHLAWKTKVENEADKIIHGTSNRGERNPRAKLTRAEIVEIRSASNTPRNLLAKKFGVKRGTIMDIRSGRSWGWLHA